MQEKKQFKVGDKLKQIRDSDFPDFNIPNEELIVSEVGFGWIRFTNMGLRTFDSDRFTYLVHPAQPGIKIKDTNPKDSVGVRKVPVSTLSGPVMMEVGAAMLEGARKYGRHNYRVAGARYSVYYDAAMRHLLAAWEGQDVDPDSGLSHLSKAIATLAVLRDSEINGKVVDDRPPASKEGWMEELNKVVSGIIDKYPDAKDSHTQIENKLGYRRTTNEEEIALKKSVLLKKDKSYDVIGDDYKIGGSCSD